MVDCNFAHSKLKNSYFINMKFQDGTDFSNVTCANRCIFKNVVFSSYNEEFHLKDRNAKVNGHFSFKYKDFWNKQQDNFLSEKLNKISQVLNIVQTVASFAAFIG